MKKLADSVEKFQKIILDTQNYIWKNPETGYKEYKTSEYLEKTFKDLGYDIVKPEGLTGFFTVVDTKKPGPEILVLAELDSVICPEHPDADKTTGAVHSCGHSAQCAAIVGVAAALKQQGALDGLCGKIKLCLVPAEELLEIEYRKNLIKEGKIKYFSGKQEFMYRGFFDTTDIAFMIHSSSKFSSIKGNIGIIAKSIRYKGVAAHAGGAPWDGKNALYAATCGINAANALRETFKEEDIIRFHPIITSGGAMVNAIPSTATIESFVRGKTYDAIIDANRRINQALCGAALSLDVNVDISDFPGYAPLVNDIELRKVFKEAVNFVLPDEEIIETDNFSSGSTDMGDLSQIMPVIHPYSGGAVGNSHGSNYYIEDPQKACIASAKVQLCMLYLLLSDNASRAMKIKKDYKPNFDSVKSYLDYIDSLNSSGDRIAYKNGQATVMIEK